MELEKFANLGKGTSLRFSASLAQAMPMSELMLLRTKAEKTCKLTSILSIPVTVAVTVVVLAVAVLLVPVLVLLVAVVLVMVVRVAELVVAVTLVNVVLVPVDVDVVTVEDVVQESGFTALVYSASVRTWSSFASKVW